MRKILIFISALVISLILTACDGNDVVITPPTYSGIRIENTDPVVDGNLVTFYKGKAETVLVEVTLNNPDNARIKSIEIDGYTYLYTKFTEDSTNSVIYFELNVGNTLGERVYSVDQINYLSGENSIAVNVTSNNEFKLYVYKDEPTVSRENYALQRTAISIDFNIQDVDSVISANTLVAKLYAGETLIETKEINSGFITVDFTNLLANRLYEVKIVASYDLDDDSGLQTDEILYSGTYSTIANGLPSASLTNIDVTSNRIDFDLSFTDEDNVVIDGGLSVVIYNDDQIVETIDVTGSTTGLNFKDLFNDNDYVIKVLADYDLRDGQLTRLDNVLAIYEFTTLPREVPLPVLDNLDIQENSIEFDVVIDDPDGIIDMRTIIAKLYIEGTFVDQAQIYNYHADFQVNNLFANKEFTIELIADYDLNDGEGVQEDKVIYSETFSTTLNERPTIEIETILVEQGYITITLAVNDENQTLMGAIDAVLYEEGSIVQTISLDADTTEIVFDYPTEAGVPYYIEFFADYNLRDGTGALYNQSLRRIVSFTAEAKKPIAEISNVVTTSGSIDFSIKIIDADNTIVAGETKVYIYLGTTLIDQAVLSVGNTNVSFTGLLSNNEYSIIVLSDYNLDDGSGVLQDQELLETAIMTDTKLIPTSETDNIETTETSISFDVSIFDQDAVIVASSIVAKLFHEGLEVDSETLLNGDNYGVEFTGLLSDNNYVVKYYVDYNLDDGVGVISDYQIGQASIRTDAKSAPVINILFSDTDQESITLDIQVIDTYDVITGDVRAVLILNEVPTGDEVALSEGINTDVIFSGIYSNERYYVEVWADYDLNDGSSIYDDEVLLSEYFLTDGYLPVTAFADNITSTINSITFDAYITDDDGVVTNNLQAVLYQDDVATGDTIPLVVGENLGVSFTGIDSATDYVIKIETDYDLNEESGEVLGEILYTFEESTPALSAPTVSFVSSTSNYNDFTIDIFVDNSDGTITGNLQAVLYKDGVATLQVQPLVDGLNTAVPFTALLANNEYEVKVFADYDLNDEAGEQLNQELNSRFVTTLEKFTPLVTATNTTLTRSKVTFDLELNDIDNVLDSTTLMAGLYVNDIKMAEKLLFTNQVSFNISGLLADFDFEIRISGDVDLDDGAGTLFNEPIATFAFTTLAYAAPTAVINNVTVNQDTVVAQITVMDDDNRSTGNLVAILYDKDDTELLTVPLVKGVNTATFSLTVNHLEMYSIVVYSDYNLLNGEGEQTDQILDEDAFIEYNELIPQSRISDVTITDTSITLDVEVLDEDATIIGVTTYAFLYLDGVKVGQQPLSVGNNDDVPFVGLLSNREYVIVIVTNYDNNDENGTYVEFQMATTTNTTNAKEEPTAAILIDTISAASILVDVVVDDDDLLSTVRTLYLKDKDGTVVDSESLAVGNNVNILFTGLTGSTEYTLEVEVTYDMEDGYGDVVNTLASQTEVTPQTIQPTASINDLTATTKSILVNYTFTDNDNASSEQYLRLYEGAVLIDEIAIVAGAAQTHTFTGTNPYTTYTVTIESTYDLNDLNGVQTDVELTTDGVTTDTPISLDYDETADIGKQTAIIEVTVDDYDNIIQGTVVTATLYQGATPIDTFIVQHDTSTQISMANLLSDFEYTLEITATYNVGNGNVVDVLYTETFTTDPMVLPVVEIDVFENWTIPVAGNITFDLAVGTDDDSVVTAGGWVAYLYVDGNLTAVDTIDIDATYGDPLGGTTTITFTGYTTNADESYTIVITALVDINDGAGAVETAVDSVAGIDAGN